MKNAAVLYHEAAAQGDARAQYNLGIMYYHGHGVSQDYERAVEWYRRAANQGDANAERALELLSANGHAGWKNCSEN